METLLKFLPFITVTVGLLTALLNLKVSLLKNPKNNAMSEISFALIAIVVVCLIVIAAICYLVTK